MLVFSRVQSWFHCSSHSCTFPANFVHSQRFTYHRYADFSQIYHLSLNFSPDDQTYFLLASRFFHVDHRHSNSAFSNLTYHLHNIGTSFFSGLDSRTTKIYCHFMKVFSDGLSPLQRSLPGAVLYVLQYCFLIIFYNRLYIWKVNPTRLWLLQEIIENTLFTLTLTQCLTQSNYSMKIWKTND